jgi:probable HAF family extracellular repeat protein
MKSERPILATAIVFLVALAISLSLGAQANAQQAHKVRYIVKDLGTLGGSFAAAGGISNTGWIEGYSLMPGDNEYHEFLYHDGVMKDLGTLGGPDSFSEYRPNNRGDAGGQSETSAFDPNGEDFCEFGTGLICLPFFWHNKKMTPQPTLGGNNGAGYGINDLGELAGTAENTTLEPTCADAGTGELFQYKPAIWKDGHIHELPSFHGDPVGLAYAINNHSQAVGQSGPCGVEVNLGTHSHAMLWQNNKAINLGSLGGTLNNLAQDINDKGQIVGLSELSGDATFHAFLWQQNKMTDLGALPGDIHSNGESINIEGEVVGRSANTDFSSGSAFVWRNGVMTDLNTLIPANSGLYLMNATSNNDLGQIVGSAVQISTGDVHVFLAIPIDCESGEGDAILFAPDTVQRPNIFLSERVRKLLQQPRRHIMSH